MAGKKQDDAPVEAPETHPEPDRWWLMIETQSNVCLAALILEIPALLYFGVGEHGSLALVILNLSLGVGFVSYNGGSALIESIKAWRSPGGS